MGRTKGNNMKHVIVVTQIMTAIMGLIICYLAIVGLHNLTKTYAVELVNLPVDSKYLPGDREVVLPETLSVHHLKNKDGKYLIIQIDTPDPQRKVIYTLKSSRSVK